MLDSTRERAHHHTMTTRFRGGYKASVRNHSRRTPARQRRDGYDDFRIVQAIKRRVIRNMKRAT